MSLSTSLIFFAAVVFLLFHADASEAVSLSKFKQYRQGLLQVGGGLSYFNADGNYNNGGSAQGLADRTGYELFETPLALRYGLTDSWSLSSALMISTAQSKNRDANRNNSTISEIHGGIDALLYQRQFDFTAELQWLYPMTSIERSQDDVMNSEGVSQIVGVLSVGHRGPGFVWWLDGGYNHRMEGRSGLLLVDLGLGHRGEQLSFGGELGGFSSILDDSDRGVEAGRYGLIQKVNGGIYRFYSVNPSVLEARAWTEWEIGRAGALMVQAGYPVWGQNFAKGISVGAFFSLSFDLFSTRRTIRRLKAPLREEPENLHERRVEEFRETVDDGVDQELFKPEPPPPPPPPRRRVIETSPSPEELKNQLDDTEMTIKLKSKKKRRR